MLSDFISFHLGPKLFDLIAPLRPAKPLSRHKIVPIQLSVSAKWEGLKLSKVGIHEASIRIDLVQNSIIKESALNQ